MMKIHDADMKTHALGPMMDSQAYYVYYFSCLLRLMLFDSLTSDTDTVSWDTDYLS